MAEDVSQVPRFNDRGEIPRHNVGGPVGVNEEGRGILGLQDIADTTGLTRVVEDNPSINAKDLLALELELVRIEDLRHEQELIPEESVDAREDAEKEIEEANKRAEELRVEREQREVTPEEKSIIGAFGRCMEEVKRRAGGSYKGQQYGILSNVISAAGRNLVSEAEKSERRRQLLKELSQE